jgi:hypothetical protein
MAIPHHHRKTTIEYQQETERESFKILMAMATKPPLPPVVVPEVQGPSAPDESGYFDAAAAVTSLQSTFDTSGLLDAASK